MDIATGFKMQVLPFGQFHRKLFDERGHVVVGNHFAFPLLDSEYFFRNLNFHVVLDLDLAGQAPVFGLFTAIQMPFFGG